MEKLRRADIELGKGLKVPEVRQMPGISLVFERDATGGVTKMVRWFNGESMERARSR